MAAPPGAPPGAAPPGAPPAAGAPPTPHPVNFDHTPTPGLTWDPTALGGKGSWRDSSGTIVTVDAGNVVNGYLNDDGSVKTPTPVPQPTISSQIGVNLPSLSDIGKAIQPTDVNTTPLQDAATRAQATQDFYRNRLVNLPQSYDPAETTFLRTRGNGAIGMLTGAANGTVPSAAELQLQRQASINAARGYGAAAALQGRTPGMALREAELGGAQIQGDTNAAAAALRAQEQATARGQLVNAIQGQQQAESGVRAGDTSAASPLIGADVNAGNTANAAAKNLVDANAVNTAAHNAFKGGIVNGIVKKVLPGS